MSSDIAVKVDNLSKCYQIYDKPRDRLLQGIMPRLQRLAGKQPKQYCREFWALRDISFEIKRGETFGVVGRNGSGKSTLLQLIAGTLMPTEGAMVVNGRIAALLELGSGFNPEFTGLENIYMNGAVLGLSKTEIESRLDDILSFADIGDFIRQQVKTYSSGMFVRLAFAVQICLEPDIMIVDEALAVGDIFFRQKCYSRLQELREKGCSIMLVSHATTEVEQFCERALLLDHGTARFVGNGAEAIKRYYLIQNESTCLETSVDPSDAITSSDKQHNCSADSFFWPDVTNFKTVDNESQVNNGLARCTSFAVCDSAGKSRRSFEQGEVAFFYFELEAIANIGVPLAGVLLRDDRGTVVHGKGMLEYDIDCVKALKAGQVIRYCQKISLKLRPCEYSFEIGFSTINAKYYPNKGRKSHNDLQSEIIVINIVPNADVFSVNLRHTFDGAQLTHHGVADLPGSINWNLI